ncbi:OmpA family protein [Clostridium sp. WILCCON 0269]|uniref:OmpA family protein n=1 Tax=Candidatus Clostridium eludens TaxID=3381663 RepID=A0ABW8SFE7_9CLOT
MFHRYSRIIRTSRDDGNIWRIFTDLLSTILLFILLFFVYTNAVKHAQLDAQKAELNKLQLQVEKIIGIRQSIIEDIRKSFKSAGLNINIDKNTGDIVFSSDVLFEFNKADIRPEFKASLDKFIPQYINVLTSPKYISSVSEIVVEGHTDDVGDYNYNMDLSQKRANSIVSYILNNNFKNLDSYSKKTLKNIITANGKSDSDLIKNSDGSINQEKSRRVIFKFRLKDEESIRQIDSILSK